jgi:cytochrome d ubiquinol oxidase subunit II
MVLQTVPMVIVLIGLVLYTVLAGADFGAGFWQLFAGGGERGREIRDHAHHSIAPVWEANHVWLILVITVLWTGYPTVFGAVFSTLAIPIFLAALGIVLRGLTYTLQNATAEPRQRRLIDTSFALSSILTPFMLGTVIGSIASGRVPVGNAAGDIVTSWLNPTSILSGALAVATGAFLAAVYLAADARRLREPALADRFRFRSLCSGVAAGALAIAGLFIVNHDAHRIYTGLTNGWGLLAIIISGISGIVSIVLVWIRRYDAARASAALAVAAILFGWAAAQRPFVLPGLTLAHAAAGDDTLYAIIISIGVGAIILFPSLALLFRLTLRGVFDPAAVRVEPPAPGPDAPRPSWAGRVAITFLIIGILLLTIAESGVAHGFGVAAFVVAAIAGFTAVGPDVLAAEDAETPTDSKPRSPLRRRHHV